jgi:hypothetical protein
MLAYYTDRFIPLEGAIRRELAEEKPESREYVKRDIERLAHLALRQYSLKNYHLEWLPEVEDDDEDEIRIRARLYEVPDCTVIKIISGSAAQIVVPEITRDGIRKHTLDLRPMLVEGASVRGVAHEGTLYLRYLEG